MKKRFITLLICLAVVLSVASFASAQGIPDKRQCARIVDDADLLSESEENALLSALDAESEENQFDFVIHTTDSLGGMRIENYADDYFDYNGFGYGENGDGVVLVIAMDIREYYISTCGRGIELFPDEAIDYCEDAFLSYLSSGDYYLACDAFINAATYVAENGIDSVYSGNAPDFDFNFDYGNGDYYYGDDYYYDEFTIAEKIGVSLIVGFIIAIIVGFTQAAKLKSVRSQRSAVNYVKENSFRLSQQSDRFLYRNVTKVRKPKQTSSSRGGGVRMGSSGRSHGGGGGRF